MPDEPEDRNAESLEQSENAGPAPDSDDDGPNTVRLFEENLSVGRETASTGRVRVRVATHEHEQAVDIPLTSERVEVERVPIGREVEAMPARRQEGDTTILPVVEEVIVMRRKLVLKEELHVRLVRSTEQHRENVTLRRQEAVIERVPAEQLSTERKPD